MYLFYGESFRLIEEEIKKIVKESPNVLTIDLEASSLKEIIEEATYVSMFQEQKYLIVRNANFFTTAKSKTKEEEIELFLKYMQNPVSLTTILFTSPFKVDARKKIYKEFSKTYKVINCSITDRNDLINKIRDMVFKQKFKIDNETILYIMESCQNNFDLIYNELEKIFLYYVEPQKIELQDVVNIVSRTLMDNNFKFVEAVIKKDGREALKILEDLYVLKVEPIALILLLAREYRLMLSIETLLRGGYPKATISKQLGLQDWQIDKFIRNMNSYNEEDLKTYLKEIASIDYRVKSGLGDAYTELKAFLLKVFMP